MYKIAIYVRKSVKSEKNSVSIDTQIKVIKDYFLKEGKKEFEIFIDDGFSGGNTNRPQLQEMLDRALKGEFRTVACYKLDRMARNTLDFLNIFNMLKEKDIDLVCVLDSYDARTPAGKMMMTLLASMSEMERENIKTRVTSSMINLAKQGRWTGGKIPFGYKVVTIENGKYLSLENKDVIIEVFNNFLSGLSIRQIAKKNNCSTIRIREMLKNITYLKSSISANEYLSLNGYEVYGEPNGKGYLPYGKRSNKLTTIATVSRHEGVIDLHTFIKVQDILKGYGGHVAPRISTLTYLAQLVYCKCGRLMIVTCGTKRKDGTFLVYFRCKNKGCSRLIRADLLEDDIFTLLSSGNPIYAENEENKDNTKKINTLRNEIKEKEIILNGLIDKLALASDKLTPVILSKAENIEKDIQDLSNKLNSLEIKKVQKVDNSKREDIRKFFVENFKNLSLEEKQRYIRKVINKIVIDENEIVIY